MSVRQSLLSAILTLSLGSSFVCANPDEKATGFTLQVAAFPESAEQEAEAFVAKLTAAGEQPIWGLIEIPEKGQWTRVFIGSFTSLAQARQYGEKLVARRLIKEFIIKKSSEIKMLSRPRSVGRKKGRALQIGGTVLLMENSFSASLAVEKSNSTQNAPLPAHNPVTPAPENLRASSASSRAQTVTASLSPVRKTQDSSRTLPAFYSQDASAPTSAQNAQTIFVAATKEHLLNVSAEASARHRLTSRSQSVASLQRYAERNSAIEKTSTLATLRSVESLPQVKTTRTALLKLAPAAEFDAIPCADPLQIALSLLANSSRRKPSPLPAGGLWVSGDRQAGLERLQWIVGKGGSDLISLDADGKVHLNAQLLAEIARLKEADPVVAPFVMLEYLLSNEGLLLVAQLTRGAYRYRLHLGRQAMTAGGEVVVQGSLNLDNNFDSRINPYRRWNRKIAIERPPLGFDSLVAINPEARWFNLPSNRLVQGGNITFHELVEAYAKVELGYQYLPTPAYPGAHNIALEREVRLKEQRPFADLVLTLGSNRMLKSEDEWRQFYAETNGARQ